MPLYLRLPSGPEAPSEPGRNPQYLNLVGRKSTALHRKLRRVGLAGWEPATQAALLTLCEAMPQITFYDVGSHIGIYSAMVSALYANRNPAVFAFEPTPQTAKMARGIIKRNRLNIDLQEIALTSHDTLCLLYLSAKAETTNSLVKGFRESNRVLTVFGRSIDSLVESGLPPPALIKCDVATYEGRVIKGALKTIERHRPFLVCELHPKLDLDEFSEVLDRLREGAYSFYRISDAKEAQGAADMLHEVEGRDVVRRIRTGGRNWLLSPTALTPAFFDRAKQWKRSIDHCTAKRNIETKKGEEPPAVAKPSGRL